MSTMQAAMKELRTLKQEESTLMNLSSKISDQLNRLKVEELALQNLVRLQNEEQERKSRGSQRSINRSLPIEGSDEENSYEGNFHEHLDKGENSEDANSMDVVPLDLFVNKYHREESIDEMEEEEEDEEEQEEEHTSVDAIERFVNSL